MPDNTPRRDLYASPLPRRDYGTATVDGAPITATVHYGGIWLVFTASATYQSAAEPVPDTHYTSDRGESWLREVLR